MRGFWFCIGEILENAGLRSTGYPSKALCRRGGSWRCLISHARFSLRDFFFVVASGFAALLVKPLAGQARTDRQVIGCLVALFAAVVAATLRIDGSLAGRRGLAMNCQH